MACWSLCRFVKKRSVESTFYGKYIFCTLHSRTNRQRHGYSRFPTKHIACIFHKFHLNFFVSVLTSSIRNAHFRKAKHAAHTCGSINAQRSEHSRPETVLSPRQALILTPQFHVTLKCSGHGNQEKSGFCGPWKLRSRRPPRWSCAGVDNFFNKRAILLHFPADMTGEETQSVDTVIFFMRLPMDMS